MPEQLSVDLASLKIDRSTQPKGGRAGAALGTVLVLAGLAGAVYRFAIPYLESAVFKTEVEVTEVTTIWPARATVQLTSTGYVAAQSVSSVAAKVAGKVKAQHVRQGAHVKVGDVLLEIDTADQRAAIASADGQAAAARARVETAKADLLDVEQQARRASALSDAGIGTEAATQDLQARSVSLKAQVQAAQADAKAQAALAAALRVNLLSYTVFAPISGTVVSKPPELGEFVGPQPAGIAVDMGGVQIADFSTLMVETDVPEQRLSQVKVGGPCEIVLDAFPTQRYRGKAAQITPKVNRTKATVTVKVAFVDENDGVLPDMAARVSFLASELDKEALKAPPKTVVPSNAVAEVKGTQFVYRLEGGVVRMTAVTLGPAVGSGFEVKSGVSAGTKIVSNPAAVLADGQRIKERDAR